jgi:superfamily II DNA or RNA helicase
MKYSDFLASKAIRAKEHGLADVPALAGHLFPFQRSCVEFALRAGSAGNFLSTGLGKTACELEWSAHAAEATNGKALILAPLSVGWQIAKEAERWGYDARVIREQDEARAGINICNYDRLDKLDPAAFGAVALDESSILKSFGGKTSRALIESFANHRFRLSATATPAPNDHMELGQQSDFLGVMPSSEMLMRWFINDTATASQEWRLKKHAVNDFWDWCASWSRMAEMPSDLGGDDTGFILPPMKIIRHRAEASPVKGSDLFGMVEMSATGMHDVKRKTAGNRAKAVAELIDSSESWVIWCDTDYEADEIKAAIPQASEIRGSQTPETKETILRSFSDGSIRILITKPSLTGFGLNWQHCARTAFVGRTFSYETWYQAVRRFWRFGQKREVEVHLIVAEGEEAIARVIDRKADDHVTMKTAMRAAMLRATEKSVERKSIYLPKHKASVPAWL